VKVEVSVWSGDGLYEEVYIVHAYWEDQQWNSPPFTNDQDGAWRLKAILDGWGVKAVGRWDEVLMESLL
jgi:hypothetical protein